MFIFLWYIFVLRSQICLRWINYSLKDSSFINWHFDQYYLQLKNPQMSIMLTNHFIINPVNLLFQVVNVSTRIAIINFTIFKFLLVSASTFKFLIWGHSVQSSFIYFAFLLNFCTIWLSKFIGSILLFTYSKLVSINFEVNSNLSLAQFNG